MTRNGFKEIELTSPKKALEEAGAEVHIISHQPSVRAWDHDHWSGIYTNDINLESADSAEYDALMIPGGVINPDIMRRSKSYVAFASSIMREGKPVAAICHGPQLLIETKYIRNRDITSFPSIKTDQLNAGANWIDKEVVTGNGLVTSRSPSDLVAFYKKLIENLARGIYAAL